MADTNVAAFGLSDLDRMGEALALANRAAQDGEVPIGAVVVSDGKIIGRGWNRNIGLNEPSALLKDFFKQRR